MDFIDLFCGCGLFTEGMKQAGHKSALGIDNWKIACKSYEANHCETICMDIKELDITTLPKVNLIIGSPPCQTFSIANRKTKTMDDTLIKKYIEIIEIIKPEYWIMEETPLAIKSVPYSCQRKILSATNYGGLQKRKRLFAGKYPLPFPKFIGVPKAPTLTTSFNRLGNGNTKYESALRNINYLKKLNIKSNDLTSILKHSKELMGVRENYILCGSLREQIKQMGNGVFVPLIKALGDELKQREVVTNARL